MSSNIVHILWEDVWAAADLLVARHRDVEAVYGIPTGGSIAALIAYRYGQWALLYELPSSAEAMHVLVLDDLVDSGKTLAQYASSNYRVDALFRKACAPIDLAPQAVPLPDQWIHFPWDHDSTPQDAVLRLQQYIGEDQARLKWAIKQLLK